MRYLLFAIAVPALSLLGGCTSINAWGSKVPMGGVKYAAVPTEQVMILFEPPTRPYEQIGLVSSIGGIYASDGDMFKTMQREAAEMGADAIILRNAASNAVSSTGGVTVVQNQSIGSPYEFPKTNAIAIKYK